MKTKKKKIEKKKTMAPNLGPFKQALAARLNPDSYPSMSRGYGRGENLAEVR
jgi:hypothetical protein